MRSVPCDSLSTRGVTVRLSCSTGRKPGSNRTRSIKHLIWHNRRSERSAMHQHTETHTQPQTLWHTHSHTQPHTSDAPANTIAQHNFSDALAG